MEKKPLQKRAYHLKVFSYALIFLGEKFAVEPFRSRYQWTNHSRFNSSKGLVFHYADEAKPLATPWQVAIERAKLVRKSKLPQGPILDPACGSGIQLAAYCAMLGRSGVGIEMDEATAKRKCQSQESSRPRIRRIIIVIFCNYR